MADDGLELNGVDSGSNGESHVTARTGHDLDSEHVQERQEQHLQPSQPAGSWSSENGTSELAGPPELDSAHSAINPVLSVLEEDPAINNAREQEPASPRPSRSPPGLASTGPGRSSEVPESPNGIAAKSPEDQDSNRPSSANSSRSSPNRTNSLNHINTDPPEAHDQGNGLHDFLSGVLAASTPGNGPGPSAASTANSSAPSAPTPALSVAAVDAPVTAQAAPATAQTTTTTTIEHCNGRVSPPPEVYPLTPTVPWLGGTAEHRSLLWGVHLDDDDNNDEDNLNSPHRLDDLMRANMVDPALVRAADRQLLVVLLSAKNTNGAETCGFESGADAEGGALRFMDLRGGSDGGGEEEQQQGFVDVELSQFLSLLRDAGSEDGSGSVLPREEEEGEVEQEEDEGGAAAPPATPPSTPPAAAQRTPSPAGEHVRAESRSSGRISLLSEGSPLRGPARGEMAKWDLLMGMLRDHSLSTSDVSYVPETQMDEWLKMPIDVAELYFETHMLDDLRQKKLEKASMKTEDAGQEMAGPSRLDGEDAIRVHREETYEQLVGSGDVREGSTSRGIQMPPPPTEYGSHANASEDGTHSETQQTSPPGPNIELRRKIILAGCILAVLLVLGIALGAGLEVGLERRKAAENKHPEC